MAFPIDRVRSQFAALSTKDIFFDNPGGTQVPRQVIEAVSNGMAGAASNLGGYFQASRCADAIYTVAHDKMAELLGGESGREIVIGQSMTMLTFQMARSLGRSWNPGEEIIVTHMDHEGTGSMSGLATTMRLRSSGTCVWMRTRACSESGWLITTRQRN
jgi:selenocysteine lyase/cysteine desulfurase